MSNFLLNFNDPDDEGYIVAQLDDYQTQAGSSFQAAFEDYEATRIGTVEHASEWYGTACNAYSHSHLLGYQGEETGFAPGPLPFAPNNPFPESAITGNFTYPQSRTISHNLTTDLTVDQTASDLPIVPSSTIIPVASALTVAPPLTVAPLLTVDPALTVAPVAPVQHRKCFEDHPSVPGDLVARLKEAGAESLACLAIDITHFLWTHMSLNTLGRTPTDNLCEGLYINAIQRRQRVQENWVPEEVNVMLPVPIQRNNAKYDFRETAVLTYLNNKLFKDALFAQLHVVARMFRENAFRCANYLVHTSSTHVGIIPIDEVTSDFRKELKGTLKIGPYGPRIFHGGHDSDNPVASNLFGNDIFRNLLREGLYEPESQGWFAFLNDTDSGPSGPVWTPLISASCYTAAYVSAWLIDAVDDFCNGVTPVFTDSKTQRVNSMANEITNVFNKAMLGFPDVPARVQNDARMSLLLFTSRAPLH